MSSMNSRLRRLEERADDRCPACALAPDEPERIVVAYDEAARREALADRCPECGRPRSVVFNVVYDDEEGGGY
jgi:hypothetical protein